MIDHTRLVACACAVAVLSALVATPALGREGGAHGTTTTAGGPSAVVAPRALHLQLQKSEPAKGAELATPPRVLRLWFSLPPELAVTSIKLSRVGGSAVALGKPRRGAGEKAPVEVDIAGVMSPGVYSVAWKTSSKDGHPVRGEFGFSVGAGG